jgi:class 3 adenylate cyclase
MLPAPTADDVLEQLAQKNPPVLSLLALCRSDDYLVVWKPGPRLLELLHRFARLLLHQGHPTLALEVASRGLAEAYPDDHELLYCRALALLNCGNTTRAEDFVRELLARSDLSKQVRSDVLSLAGRIPKDRANRTRDPNDRVELRRLALDFYRQAYELSGDTFPGINAASLALLCGEPELSLDLAGKVRDDVRKELEKDDKKDDYWLHATLGEASVLLGDPTAAHTRYARAAQLARNDHKDGDLISMRRQLLMLREHRPVGDEVLGLFHFPPVPALEEAVKARINQELEDVGASIGYCSPGCGSDILFGELMRKRGGELHVVLPFDEQDFIDERVTYGLPDLESWRGRYKELCGGLRVTTHFATKEPFLNDQVLHDFNGVFMQGLALTRAEQVGVPAIAVVVQDSTVQSSQSGLATFVENWKKTGRELRIINLAAVRAGVPLTAAAPEAVQERPARRSERTVKAMLFADVAGFSGLPEEKLPAFFLEFLGIVEKQLEKTSRLFANTWGDGLYIVFADAVSCADFALRLLEQLERIDFKAFRLVLKKDKKPGVRIGLHTGPVFEGRDPIIEKINYFGSHVSRAARIEPVTAPGCAFVSEQFAAALALTPGHNFLCEYLGLQPLAKDYDRCPLYRLTYRTC